MWSKPPIFTIFCLHFYKFCLHLCSSRCCQNTCKMHVVQIPFGCLHKCFNISSILFFCINQHLMVTFNVFHGIQAFFFPFNGPCKCLLLCLLLSDIILSNPRHFVWHVTNCSCSASCFNVTSWNCICIMPISSHNASKTCSTMWICFVEDNMLASCANRPWSSIMSNGK
jgi:hypothetical protein